MKFKISSSALLTALLLADVLGAGILGAGRDPGTEPIVLTGEELPTLVGKDRNCIVAFAVHGGRWRQVPVQIDERAVLPFSKILKRRQRGDPKSLFYTDAKTFTGADPDPAFDRNDELVLLGTDAGGPALEAAPDGVDENTRVELRFHTGTKQGAGAYKENYKLGRGTNPESSHVAAGETLEQLGTPVLPTKPQVEVIANQLP